MMLEHLGMMLIMMVLLLLLLVVVVLLESPYLCWLVRGCWSQTLRT